MTIWKKALSVATSAALLASLLITAVAPAALASVTVVSAGNVPVGGTSAGTVTFTFTEQSATALTNAAGQFDVTISPKTPGGAVTFSGTPSTAGSPGSLGATASILGSVLTVKFTGSDPANTESIIVSGLKIAAAAGTTLGAINAEITGFGGQFASVAAVAAAFTPNTKAQGTLSTGYASGTTSIVVNVTGTTCLFAVTAGADPGKLDFATSAESKDITVVSALGVPSPPLGPGQQQLTIAATANNHQLGEAVSQTRSACGASPILASPGTVANVAEYKSSGDPTVFPGENNSKAGDLRVIEKAAGFLAKDTTLTFTISTAGVVFSKPPPLVKAGDIEVSGPILSADRKSAVVTVTKASTAASQVWLGDINGVVGPIKNPVLYDVAATVPGGTFVTVGLVLSGGLLTDNATRTNAVVFRGITATAPTPIVYIGENNQAAGLVTLVESAAGFFQSGTGPNNTLEVCPQAVKYDFTVAPWAKVTAGDLKLREGSVVSPDNIVEGTLVTTGPNKDKGCYKWTVWTSSTVVSTIVIGNSTFATGPLLNVKVNQAPGTVVLEVYSGDASTIASLIANVGFANATYRTQVAVTALSQPAIAPGATNAPAGDLQIAETGLGQLKRDQSICVEVLWRSGEAQDQFLNSLITADLPIATASGGVVVGPVVPSLENCGKPLVAGPTIPSGYMRSFSFPILQQSTAGTGKVVISNIRLTTLTDSAEGPVQLSVWGLGLAPTEVNFKATVSNAIIGVKPAIRISALSALGVPPNQGPASTSTKVAQPNKFITWRFAGGSALAGKTVRIYVAIRNSAGGYGPFQNLTGRVADANGNAFFSWRATKTWVSVRAYFPGDNSYAASWSPVTQGRWL